MQDIKSGDTLEVVERKEFGIMTKPGAMQDMEDIKNSYTEDIIIRDLRLVSVIILDHVISSKVIHQMENRQEYSRKTWIRTTWSPQAPWISSTGSQPRSLRGTIISWSRTQAPQAPSFPLLTVLFIVSLLFKLSQLLYFISKISYDYGNATDVSECDLI